MQEISKHLSKIRNMAQSLSSLKHQNNHKKCASMTERIFGGSSDKTLSLNRHLFHKNNRFFKYERTFGAHNWVLELFGLHQPVMMKLIRFLMAW